MESAAASKRKTLRIAAAIGDDRAFIRNLAPSVAPALPGMILNGNLPEIMRNPSESAYCLRR
jgi:hypothetical protein